MSSARRCDQCHAPIHFAAITRKDGGTTRMPIDLKPHMKGNIAASKDVHGVIRGRILKGDEGIRPLETRYQTHFATCPAHHASPGPQQPKPATLF